MCAGAEETHARVRHRYHRGDHSQPGLSGECDFHFLRAGESSDDSQAPARSPGAVPDGQAVAGPGEGAAAGPGGGEAGPEAVVGVQSLREMIQEAIYSQTNSLIVALTANAGNASGGTIVVQIGDEKVDAMISRSISRQNFRSGGR